MLKFNSRYQYAANKSQTHPRITIQMFFGDDDSVYFTSHDDIGRPQGAEGVDGCIVDFSGATQKIDAKNSVSSIGSISFTLADIDNRVSQIIAEKNAENKSPRHRKLVVYHGFGPHFYSRTVGEDGELTPAPLELIDWLDYEQQFTMITQSYETGPKGFRFTAQDIQRLEHKNIFIPQKTTLVESVTAEQMFIPVAEIIDTPKFKTISHDASYSDRPNEYVGYVRIENEVISHRGITNHSSFGVSLEVIERGALNTRPAGHQVDEGASSDRKTKVEEFIYLEGPALKLLYAIQTGILYGQDDERLPDHWQQGISPEFVRLSDYTDADPQLWEPVANVGRTLRFEGLAKENGESFIRKEILSWLVGIRPVYRDGAIGFKKLKSVLSESSFVFQLNNSNIVSLGNIKHRIEDVINQISIDWDYSFLSKSFLKTSVVADLNSISKHKDGEPRRLSFKGAKSSNQSDEDLRNILNSYRNRYAGGGMTLDVSVLPRVNRLETGDLVQVVTDQLIDPLTAQPLARIFEVQQITPRANGVKLSLFASTEAAGEFREIGESTVLADEFYTSEGVSIGSVATMSGNTIIEDVTLIGGGTLGQGIFYWNDNLSIAAGVTVTIIGNVQLRVRGRFTRNGDIAGVGNGHPGGAGGNLFTENNDDEIGMEFPSSNGYELIRHILTDSEWLDTNEQPGVSGYIGDTQPSNFTMLDVFYDTSDPETFNIYRGFLHNSDITTGGNSAADRISLINRDGFLEGVNNLDLRGTSGGGGHPLILRDIFDPNPPLNYYYHRILQPGPAGGASGAGLLIICRGESVGVSSMIDLSGLDGEYSQPYDIGAASNQVAQVVNTGGAGGYPGAYYLLIDGNNSFGSGVTNITQNRGLSGLDPDAEIVDLNDNSLLGENEWILENNASKDKIGFGRGLTPSVDMGEAGFKVQFIPVSDSLDGPILQPKYKLQPINGDITLTSGTPELLGSKDGTVRERIKVTFNLSIEAQAHDYEIQAKQTSEGDSAYRTVAIVTTGEAFIDVTEGLSYVVRIRVRGIDDSVEFSDWRTSSPHTAIGKSEPPSPVTGFSAVENPDGTVLLSIDEHPDQDFLEYIFTYDNLNQEIYRGNSTSFNWGLRPSGNYTLTAVARDRSGNLSDPLTINFAVALPSIPTGFNVVIDDSVGVVLTVDAHPDSDFSRFIIRENGNPVFEGSSTRVERGFVPPGSYTYQIVATDYVGNTSLSAVQVVSIDGPPLPNVVTNFAGENVVFNFSGAVGDYPITQYEISLSGQSLAIVNATIFSLIVDWPGERQFTVSAIDRSGMKSPPRQVNVNPMPPGLTDFSAVVVDNFVEFTHRPSPGSLPISRFELYRGQDLATAEKFEDMAGGGTFTPKFESREGIYHYILLTYDTAGNLAEPSYLSVRLSQPAGYILFNRFSDSDDNFPGLKDNCYAYNGSLFGLVGVGETWQEYSNNGYETFVDEDDAQFDIWLTPGVSSGDYERTYDLGATLDSSVIDSELSTILIGNPEHKEFIEYSNDGINFEIIEGNQALAREFRYVKRRIEFTSPSGDGRDLVRVVRLDTSLSLKEQGESGRVFIDDTVSQGVFVPLSKPFIDVTSISVTPNSIEARYATYIFEDIPNPTGFYIRLFDNQGNRTTGEVSWSVRGYLST